MKEVWKRVLAACLVLITGLLAGCGGNSSNEKKVSVGILRLTSSAPLFIALDKGFFKDEGLRVEPEWFDAAQPIAVATASNKVDVGATGITAGLYNMAAQGQKLYIVADKGREEAGYPSTAVVVNKNAYENGVRSIADLKGKKVGITQIGSTYHYMLGRMLELDGLRLIDTELVPLGKVSAMMAALQAQQVDAVLLNEPNTTKAVREGYAVQIQAVGDKMPYQTSGIFYSPQFAKDTDAAVRFMKAYIRACRYYSDAMLQKEPGANYDEVLSIIAKYTNMPKEDIKNGIPYIDANGELLASDITTQLHWYASHGFLEKQLDADQVTDMSFWKQAMEKLQ